MRRESAARWCYHPRRVRKVRYSAIMNPCFSYIGGKTAMRRYICPLVDAMPYHVYCEPFAGAASIFFGLRHKPATYILNDISKNIFAFYDTAIHKPAALIAMCKKRGLVSDEYALRAQAVVGGADATTTERAWAVWYNSSVGFAGAVRKSGRPTIDKAWVKVGRSRSSGRVQALQNRIKALPAQAALLGKYAHVVNRDWHELCKRNANNADGHVMFYVDPPYLCNTQKCYDADTFTESNMQELLNFLQQCGQMFILSHYRAEWLCEWAAANDYNIKHYEMTMKMDALNDNKARTESVVYNFQTEFGLL